METKQINREIEPEEAPLPGETPEQARLRRSIWLKKAKIYIALAQIGCKPCSKMFKKGLVCCEK